MDHQITINNITIGSYNLFHINYFLKESSNLDALYVGLLLLVTMYLHAIFSHYNIPLEEMLFFTVFSFGIPCFLVFITSAEWFNDRLPRDLIAILLPLRIFLIVFGMDVHFLHQCIPQLIILNTFGMAIFVLLFGFTMNCIYQPGFTWSYIICYGIAMVSTDGYSLIKLLKSYDVPYRFRALLTADNVTVLAHSLIIMEMYIGYIDGILVKFYQFVFVYTRLLALGLVFGFLVSKLCDVILSRAISNMEYRLLFWIFTGYFMYYLCENFFFCSGPFATFVFYVNILSEKTKITLKANRRVKLLIDTWQCIVTGYVYQFTLGMCVIHLLQNVSEKTIFLSLGSILFSTLSRIACVLCMYVFTFRRKTQNQYAIMLMCCGRTGVLELNKLLILFFHPTTHNIIRTTIISAIFTMLAQTILNNLISIRLLRAWGKNTVNLTRITNIVNCLSLLEITKSTYLSMNKMDKQLGDANWKVISDATDLYDAAFENSLAFWERERNINLRRYRPQCIDCQDTKKVITKQDNVQIIKEIKMLILQAQKVSFIRQKERGLLVKSNLKFLLYVLDNALQSSNLRIDITTDLLSILHKRSVLQKVRDFLNLLIKEQFFPVPPRNYNRYIIYKMVKHPVYMILIYFTIIADIVLFYWQIYQPCTQPLFNTLPYTVFMLDIIFRVIIYWHIKFWPGFRNYLRNPWNRFDLILQLLYTLELSLPFHDFECSQHHTIFGYVIIFPIILCISSLRLLKIVHFFYEIRAVIIKLCNKALSRNLLVGYSLAMSILFGYQEVLHILPDIIDNQELLCEMETQLVREKAKVLTELSNIQFKITQIAVTSKTRRIVNTSINIMRETALALKLMGYAKEFEYRELINRVEKLRQPMIKLSNLKENTPDQIFQSLPFFKNVRGVDDIGKAMILQEFAANECILTQGTFSDGIYIIIEGMAISESAAPYEVYARKKHYGAIPVKDYLCDIDFHRSNAHYIIAGNCIGMLSYLTGRYCDNNVRTIVRTKAYYISSLMLDAALKLNNDPVHGLESKLWKYVSVNLALGIIWKVPIYRNLRMDETYYYMEKSFVPITVGYDLIQISDNVEDLILIEGRIEDANTKRTYVAPCYVPRSVRKIILTRKRALTIEPRLFIVPLRPDLQSNIYDLLDMKKSKSYSFDVTIRQYSNISERNSKIKDILKIYQDS